MKTTFTLIFAFLSFSIFSQKKVLEHSDLELWNALQNEHISPNGNYVVYGLEKGEKDQTLKLKSSKGNLIFEYARGEKGEFSYDSNYVLFAIKPWKDSITVLKQRKTKKDKMPKDTLGIYNIQNGNLVKIPNMKSFKTPEKWSGYVAYYLEDIKADKPKSEEADTTAVEKKEKKKKQKKVSKQNGHHLVIRNLVTQKEDTLKFVTDYTFAKKGNYFAYTTTGENNNASSSVHVINLEKQLDKNIYEAKKAKYAQLDFSDSGKKLAFIVDTDTTKIQIRPNALYFLDWRNHLY